MEAELTKESVVRGHHVYKSVWTPIVGERLPVLREPDNPHDNRAVAVYLDGNIVGHVPRELSKIFWFYLKHGGKITCEITGWRKRGKGLEVPCIYIMKGSRRMVDRVREQLG